VAVQGRPAEPELLPGLLGFTGHKGQIDIRLENDYRRFQFMGFLQNQGVGVRAVKNLFSVFVFSFRVKFC
jgi:hypothetical protein